MQRVKHGIFALAAAGLSALAMACFLASPARYAESVRQGVSLWAVSVLPATFPFLFLTAIFTATPLFAVISRLLARPMKALFRVSGGGGCVAALAAVSGYPVGARATADLAAGGRLPKEQAFRTACLVTTSGPAFLVGVVGSAMAGSAQTGWLLLLSHFLGVWTVSFFARFFAKKSAELPAERLQRAQPADALLSSVLAILCVGGSIALFSAFGQMVCDLLPASTPPYAAAFLRGLMEMTTGCALFAPLRTPAALAACAFFVTFGGACVLLQQAGFLKRAGVKFAPFAAVKLLQGGAAALYCYLFCLLFY